MSSKFVFVIILPEKDKCFISGEKKHTIHTYKSQLEHVSFDSFHNSAQRETIEKVWINFWSNITKTKWVGPEGNLWQDVAALPELQQ